MERKITAIMAAIDGRPLVEDVVRCLDRQTARSMTEILILSPWPEQFTGMSSLREGDRVERCAEGELLEYVRAQGVRSATTKYVAIFEDHCLPDIDWIEKVLRRLEEGHAIVAGAIAIANPTNSLSIAGMLLFYGEFLPPAQGGVSRYVPGHTNAYRRDVLLGFGDTLAQRMFSETVIMEILLAQGERFYFEADTRAHHFESSFFRSYPKVLFCSGQNVAGRRGQRMKWPARLVMGLAFPALALRRIWFSFAAYRRTQLPEANPLTVGALLVIMAFTRSLGDGVGYLFGPGYSGHRMSSHEHNRKRYLRPGEWESSIERFRASLGWDRPA